MIVSIELQIISRILTSTDTNEVETLCEFDDSYYTIFKPHIQFILNHKDKYGNVPDPFTFQSQFPDVTLIQVNESLAYLVTEIAKNKRQILMVETFNKIKDLGSDDVDEAWEYLELQCERASTLDTTQPLDLVKQAKERSQRVIELSKQARIPTGFPEIDEIMYGGLSTVEELLLLIARTNNGKSWVATEIMQSAQANGFPVLYYSPEMQSCYLGTRFDTWRGHFQNSQLHRGNYTQEYLDYLSVLEKDETSAFVLEDKDAPGEVVNVPVLKRFVKKNKIKLVVIDGLSYMEDANGKKGDSDYVKYKNLCADLFKMSKQCSCAVIVVMQANRASKDTKDDKGEVFPNIYNIEGSDHPARIATQVFAMRQIFDKHILDIRLEKSRNANNQKPEFSYAWDINTGKLQYITSDGDGASSGPITPVITPGIITEAPVIGSVPVDIDTADDEDVEF